MRRRIREGRQSPAQECNARSLARLAQPERARAGTLKKRGDGQKTYVFIPLPSPARLHLRPVGRPISCDFLRAEEISIQRPCPSISLRDGTWKRSRGSILGLFIPALPEHFSTLPASTSALWGSSASRNFSRAAEISTPWAPSFCPARVFLCGRAHGPGSRAMSLEHLFPGSQKCFLPLTSSLETIRAVHIPPRASSTALPKVISLAPPPPLIMWEAGQFQFPPESV